MRLYENSFDRHYDEFRTLYYPVDYRGNLEMEAIWRAQGGMLDDMRAAIIRAVDNNFIEKADAEALARLENYFYIIPDAHRSMDDLRALILSFYRGTRRFGEPEIREIFGAFTNGKIDVSFLDGNVTVKITHELSERFNLKDCEFILRKRIPAHLRLGLWDNILPIALINHNSMFFRDLRMAMRISNFAPVIRFNGERKFDGSWLFHQGIRGGRLRALSIGMRLGNASDMRAKDMRVDACFRTESATGAGVSVEVEVGARTDGSARQEKFGVWSGFGEKNALSGAVVMDSMWRFNGEVKFDGSRKFHAKIIQEEI